MLARNSILLSICLFGLINCHGWIEDPPSRNVRAFMPEMNCGTFMRQWYYNGGKCGVCGDDFSGAQPHITTSSRQFRVSRTYTSGDIVEIKYRLTANHLGGRHEFKICPLTNPTVEVTQECLDQNPLEIVPGQRDSIPNEPYRAIAPGMDALFSIRVKIPEGFSCDHCTLQWTWVVNNTRGVLPDGSRQNGVGPRETFRNCGDIAIRKNPNSNVQYVPRKVEPTPELYLIYPNTPIVFTCAAFGPAPARNMEPDPFLYVGSGLICYHLNRYNQDCELCRRNCSTPNTICPAICQCRWYGPIKKVLSATSASTEVSSTTTSFTRSTTTSTSTTTSSRSTSLTRSTTTAFSPINTSSTRISTSLTTSLTSTLSTAKLEEVLSYCNSKTHGFYSHPSSCTNFIMCYGTYSQVLSCPPGYSFDPILVACEPSENYVCDY